MKFSAKRRWSIIRQYVIGWILAFMFLSIVRGEGTEELGSVQWELGRALLGSFWMGLLFGAISGVTQIITEERGYKQISLGKLLAFRTLYAILFLASMIVLAYLIYGENITLLEFAFEPGSLAIYFYILTVDIFMFCLRQVNLFLGRGNLWKLLTGKFYSPREEERIFMFMDLRASTEHAERLGHIQYSTMIQECFNDLGTVVEHESEIYQYVGDEVILTWKLANGLKNQNCIKAFYRFRDQLEKKKEHYLRNFDCHPQFKAGVHAGTVTVTEVGKYKKEIAYHGDTINTAARIQGKCNALGEELLISEDLKVQLDLTGLKVRHKGHVALRGKKLEVSVYSVARPVESANE